MTANLMFSPYELDKAVLQHSQLYQKVQENYAISCSVRDEKKKFLEETYAKVSLGIRDQANSEGKKLTEDLVKQLTLLDLEYQVVTTAWLNAKLDADLWGALKESYSSRGYMIKESANLWIAGYFTTTSISNAPSVSEVQTQQVRSAMALKRKEFKRE
jgi:hypothetical protein